MISAVFDCTIFLQAVTSRKGPAAGCLVLVDEKHVKLFVSADILKEIGEVLDRPKIRKSFPKLTDEVVQEFLEHTVEVAHTVENVRSSYRLARDPDDEALSESRDRRQGFVSRQPGQRLTRPHEGRCLLQSLSRSFYRRSTDIRVARSI